MLGCRPVVKMTNIEGMRYGVNGEQEKPIYNRFVFESEANEVNCELRGWTTSLLMHVLELKPFSEAIQHLNETRSELKYTHTVMYLSMSRSKFGIA